MKSKFENQAAGPQTEGDTITKHSERTTGRL